jgi:hypothetical protein
MRFWYEIGLYSSAAAFVLDIYNHQLGLAVFMALVFYLNYWSLNNLEK